MKKHRVTINPERLKAMILRKMTMTDMAVLIYPNIKERGDALHVFNVWFKKGMMPVDKYEKIISILKEAKDNPQPNRSQSAEKPIPDTFDSIPRRTDNDFPIVRYQSLAAAIVSVAASDYLRAYRYLKKENQRKWQAEAARSDIYLCERFFLGSQFPILMETIDGEAFLEKLKGMAESGAEYKPMYMSI